MKTPSHIDIVHLLTLFMLTAAIPAALVGDLNYPGLPHRSETNIERSLPASKGVLDPNRGYLTSLYRHSLQVQIEPDTEEGIVESKSQYKAIVTLENTGPRSVEILDFALGPAQPWEIHPIGAASTLQSTQVNDDSRTLAESALANNNIRILEPGSRIVVGKWVPCDFYPCMIGAYSMQFNLPVYYTVQKLDGNRSLERLDIPSNTLAVNFHEDIKPRLDIGRKVKNGDQPMLKMSLTNKGQQPVILLQPPVAEQVLFPAIYRQIEVRDSDRTLAPNNALPRSTFTSQEMMHQLETGHFITIEPGDKFVQTYRIGDYYSSGRRCCIHIVGHCALSLELYVASPKRTGFRRFHTQANLPPIASSSTCAIL